MAEQMAARSGSQCGPLPEGISVAANGCPSAVPLTLTARRVPSSSAEPGTVR
jgi:hypothetical protein